MNRNDDKFPARRLHNQPAILGQRIPEHLITRESVLKELNDSVIKANMIADGSVSSRKVIQPPSDNLVPNGYSELGQAALDAGGLEAQNLVHDPANAYEGEWCRKITLDSITADTYFTDFIPCLSGEKFFVDLRLKASASTFPCFGVVQFYDANKVAVTLGIAGPTDPASTTYQSRSAVVTASPTACFLKLAVRHSTNVSDVGKSLYVDALSLRKCVAAPMIVAATIETSGYVEDTGYTFPDGTHPALTGAKISNEAGTAIIRTDGNGIAIGRYTINDAFFRALNTIDGDTTSGYSWRGNNDPSTRGGAPDTSCLQWIPQYSTAFSPGGTFLFCVNRWEFLIARKGNPGDNLDGLSYIEVIPYHGNTTSAAAATTVFLNPPAARPGGAGAAVSWEQLYSSNVDSVTSTPSSGSHWFLKMRLWNDYGNGDYLWYSPPPSNGMAVSGSLTSPITGQSGGGGGGGIGGIGGACPCPWVPLQVSASGLTLPASAFVGAKDMKVWTQHEKTGEWGYFPVTSATYQKNVCVGLWFADGRYWEGALNHKFAVKPGQFVDLRELDFETTIYGPQPGRIVKVEPRGYQTVVQLTVEEAHTMVHIGLLGHNAIKQ